MNAKLHPEMRTELRLAIETSRKDFGAAAALRLYEAIDAGVDRIVLHPDSFPIAEDSPQGAQARELILTRFPFRIVYVNENQKPHLLALAHLNRRPGYWKYRIPTH